MRILFQGNNDATNEEVGWYLAGGGDPKALTVEFHGSQSRLRVIIDGKYYIVELGSHYLFAYRSDEYALMLPSGEFVFVGGMNARDQGIARQVLEQHLRRVVQEINHLRLMMVPEAISHPQVQPQQQHPPVIAPGRPLPTSAAPPTIAPASVQDSIDAIAEAKVRQILEERDRRAREAEESRRAREQEAAKERRLKELEATVQQMEAERKQKVTAQAPALELETVQKTVASAAPTPSLLSSLTMDHVFMVLFAIFVGILVINRGPDPQLAQQNQLLAQKLELQGRELQQLQSRPTAQPVIYERRSYRPQDQYYDEYDDSNSRESVSHRAQRKQPQAAKEEVGAAVPATNYGWSYYTWAWILVAVFVLWAIFCHAANQERIRMEAEQKARKLRN